MHNIYIIDAGHGNDTPGKRSPDGKLLEWANNRRVARAICGEMARQKLRHFSLMSTCPIDVSIKQRIAYINWYCKKVKGRLNPVVISVHSNAAGQGWSPARGYTTWCHNSKTSKALATSIQGAISDSGIWNEPPRIFNRGVRLTNWYKRIGILDKTKCTAALLELGFHTSREDVALIQAREYPGRIAKAVVRGLK